MSLSRKVFNETIAPRVSMADAVDLDAEIHRIFKEQLLKMLNDISPKLLKWEPEMDTLLHLLIFKLSVLDMGASFGQQLLNMKYSQEASKCQMLTLAMLKFGVHYLHQRTSELTSLLNEPIRDKVLRIISWIELGVQISTLLNIIMFLRKGVFPTLAERLVGVKLVSASARMRTVGYSFMTRELLWHGFSELIVFTLPLINYRYLRGWFNRTMGLSAAKPTQAKDLVYTIATRCIVCQQPPILPHLMGCAHAFCYYCLQSNLQADPKFACPSCGYIMEDDASIQPLRRPMLANMRL